MHAPCADAHALMNRSYLRHVAKSVSAVVETDERVASRASMPSLLRFLTILAVLGGLGFGAVYALATFVKPATREMVTPVPLTRIGQ